MSSAGISSVPGVFQFFRPNIEIFTFGSLLVTAFLTALLIYCSINKNITESNYCRVIILRHFHFTMVDFKNYRSQKQLVCMGIVRKLQSYKIKKSYYFNYSD
jgi:hypothetical protein